MAKPYTGTTRVELYGDTVKAATFIGRARVHLGALMERIRLTGAKYGRWEFQEGDAYYRLTVLASIAVAAIFVVAATATTLEAVQSALWLPRGLILYPSSDTSPQGWGTPNQFASGQRFANPTPGLDVAQWTVGGGLGEVLLSKQTALGYPEKSKVPLPLFYEAKELTTDYTPPANDSKWSAYRIEFDTFDNSPGARVVWDALNNNRDYLLPTRGKYEAALRSVQYVRSTDFDGGHPYITDHDMPAAPVGYVTAEERKTKDGFYDTAAIESVTTAVLLPEVVTELDDQLHLSDATFTPDITSLQIAVTTGGLTAGVASEQQQWLAYGNRYWIGDDPVLPTVSWDGFPGWNWPAYLVNGTTNLAGDAWVDLDTYDAVVCGEDKKLFSKKIYAYGRVWGELPDWVLSVGVQTRIQDNVTIDRVVVLAYRLSDQPPYHATGFNAFKPYVQFLRAYYVDVPRRNGIALSPTHPIKTTDWTYAGLLQIYPPGYVVAGSYTGLLQPPQFSGDGTRAVWISANYDDGYNIIVGTFAIEGVFNSLTPFDVTVTAPNLDVRSEHPIRHDTQYCLGIDYVPKSTQLRFFYVVFVVFGGDGVDQNAIRWSASGQLSQFVQSTDIPANIDFSPDNFQFAAAWILDPRQGAAIGVHQHYSGGHSHEWKVFTAVNGNPVQSFVAPDPITSTQNWVSDVSGFNNWTALGLGAFAKQNADYIAGIELTIEGHLITSIYDASLGNLATITRTPGTSVRYYPVGAI